MATGWGAGLQAIIIFDGLAANLTSYSFSTTGATSSLDFSDDGLYLAAGGMDNTLNVYNVTNNYSLVFSTNYGAKVNKVDFSSDTCFLAAGSAGKAYIYNASCNNVTPSTIHRNDPVNPAIRCPA